MLHLRWTLKSIALATAVSLGSLSFVGSAATAKPTTAKAGVVKAGKVPACILKGKRLQGQVYIEKSKYSATFKVYQASTKYSSDLSVFSTKYQYSANKCGIWYFTNSKYSADFSVYFVNSKYSADFSVYFTNSQYQVGPN
jgi:hypothetical protein